MTARGTVVLLDPPLGALLPAAALSALRLAGAVYAGDDIDRDTLAALDVPPAPPVDALLTQLAGTHVVVIATQRTESSAAALIEAGATVIETTRPAGSGLLDAVSVMDRLRSPGGCPWDAEQTHESLRQYLVEECFELLEAIEDGDRGALREELGDVLLQVLFHSRVAQEDGEDPFSVDDVADELVTKLVGRHPHVFAGGDPAVHDAGSQERRWEELKQVEKRRESSVDGVALGQPALALAAKLAQRTARAGLPGDLLPKHDSVGARLFDLAALAKLAGTDPEGELRTVARTFAEQVRAAERAAKATGVDPATMGHEDWRAHWPR